MIRGRPVIFMGLHSIIDRGAPSLTPSTSSSRIHLTLFSFTPQTSFSSSFFLSYIITGNRIITVRTRDGERDRITYGIEPALFLDGSKYFTINPRTGEVLLRESLDGQVCFSLTHTHRSLPTLRFFNSLFLFHLKSLFNKISLLAFIRKIHD